VLDNVASAVWKFAASVVVPSAPAAPDPSCPESATARPVPSGAISLCTLIAKIVAVPCDAPEILAVSVSTGVLYAAVTGRCVFALIASTAFAATASKVEPEANPTGIASPATMSVSVPAPVIVPENVAVAVAATSPPPPLDASYGTA
jgi:hypothetical protein